MSKSWRSTFHQSSRQEHSRSSGQENCHCDAKVNLTPNSTAVSSPSKWTELTMSSTCIGYCSSAFMNTEVCDVSQYSQLSTNQSTCFSRITSFPPTVNPPLQMSCCHGATVLAVRWFWSHCPPPPFWCRPQFHNSLKAPHVLGLPCCALWHPAKGSSAASGFSIFQKLPAFAELWVLLPSSKSAVPG